MREDLIYKLISAAKRARNELELIKMLSPELTAGALEELERILEEIENADD